MGSHDTLDRLRAKIDHDHWRTTLAITDADDLLVIKREIEAELQASADRLLPMFDRAARLCIDIDRADCFLAVQERNENLRGDTVDIWLEYASRMRRGE